MKPPLRILHYTSLYPNTAQPIHGIFVEQRLRHLLASGEVEARVVAPVPWPQPGRLVARCEERHGVRVHHPAFFHLPGLGMMLAPWSMALASWPLVARLAREEPFDLIDAHYFYPDGVAAAWLARRLNKPLVVTGRGTDLNLLPRYALPRYLIRHVARQAAAIVTVCDALQQPLRHMGIADEAMVTLRNGVDLTLFRPLPRQEVRAALGVQAPTLLAVGHLVGRKNVHLILQALSLLPGVHLMVVGQGPMEGALRRQVVQSGLEGRVRFVGQIPQEALAAYYSAADALVLASDREGWANCLLEAMACGTPVAVTHVWGASQVVTRPEAGRLIPHITPQAIAQTCADLLAHPPDRQATREYAAAFSWQATVAGQLALFRHLLK